MEALDILIPAGVALAVTALATPQVARIASRAGIVDQPNARKVSQRSDMPLLGGLAVALGFAAGLATALAIMPVESSALPLVGLAVGAGIMLLTGIYDDRAGMSAWPKFALQIGAAAVAIACGFQIDHVTEPISHTLFFFPGWLVWLVTTLWIVGITNAVNLIDGLDGLATGVAVIIGSTLTVISAQAGQPVGVCIGVALVGALLGFLPFNFSPARIFLGDTGSLFIGYGLALLSLEGYRRVTVLTFVVPLLALAVPLLDTALSIVRRLHLRAPIFTADRLHMHHRLLEAQGSPRGAVIQFYILTACFCLIALAFTRLKGGTSAAFFLGAVVVLTLRLLWNLGAFSWERGGDRADDVPAAAKEQER